MAGRNIIKGITVEIGGDTTNLGRALESVNKQGDNLSSELAEINRLLKFNPDSAELLAQKQKVLANTISNTSEKLETLREAERQVQRQFERGEVSEEQVRALRREIVATEGKLKSYQEQAEGATKETKELGDTAADTGSAFEGMGSKVGGVVKAGIGAVVAGATAAVGTLVASAEASREYRMEMGKLNTAYEAVGHRTEIASEAYKRLQSVIGETDQSVEAAQQIALLADSEEDVIQWADLGAGVIARFGDALQPEMFYESANETIKLGVATGGYVQLLEGAGYSVDEFNKGLAACTSETEKQAYMLEVTEEILGDAADMYRETNAEVIRATAANEEWAATMAEAGAAVEPILTDVKMLGASLLSDLMPGITDVTTAFRGLINGDEGAAAAIGEAVSGLLTQILDMAVELLPTLVEVALSLLTSLVTTIIGMLPQLLDTLTTVIVSILDGLTEAIPLITQAILDTIPKLVDAIVAGIPQIIEGAVELFLAILEAIPLIVPALIATIPTITLAVIEAIVAAIPDLIEGALQFLMAIVEAIPLLLDELLPQIPTIIDTIIDGLLDNLPLLVDASIQLFSAIIEAIPEIAATLYENVPDIVASIVEGLLDAIPALWDAGVQLLEGLIEGMMDFDFGGALGKIGDGIVKGFKKVFDIHSPSRVMVGIGELLDEGLAVGIEDNAKAPVNAIDRLSEDMLEGTSQLNGINLERKLTHSFNPAATNTTDGLSSKLDQIYRAILAGQVIMLDGKTLVGSTADRYDNELGQRRVLAERGAL